MIVIEIFKIIILVLLCAYSSITDIKRGIIENRIVLISIIIGLILDVIGWVVFDSSYVIYQLINILIVAFISTALYALHIWAGGDCKLILAISLIIPYELYISFFNKWTSLMILIAIVFCISYVYLVFDSIIYAIKKKKIINKEKFLNNLRRIIGRWICCVSYIIMFDQIIMNSFPNIISKFQIFLLIINICIIFIVSGFKILRNKFVIIGVIIAGVIIKIIFNQSIIDKFMLINYSLVILFIILRIFIDEYNREIIETSKVEKGMILSTATTLLFVNSRVKELPNQSTEDLRSRLTAEEAESIRRWEKSKYGTPTVEIIRKIPFAIFISIGTIIFLVLGAIMK